MQRNEQILSVVARTSDKYILSIQYMDDSSGVVVPSGYTKYDILGTLNNTGLQKRNDLDNIKLINQFDSVTKETPSDFKYDDVLKTASLVPPIHPVFLGKKVTTRKEVKRVVLNKIKMLYLNIDGGDDELKFMRQAINGSSAQKLAAKSKHDGVADLVTQGKDFIVSQGWV